MMMMMKPVTTSCSGDWGTAYITIVSECNRRESLAVISQMNSATALQELQLVSVLMCSCTRTSA